MYNIHTDNRKRSRFIVLYQFLLAIEVGSLKIYKTSKKLVAEVF